MNQVEIIVVGNEVLLGMVLDTNSGYLCRVVRGMGGKTRQICTVGDRIEQIAAAVRSSVERRSALILTCGGLGPTADDLTLAAIANAVGRTLEENEIARESVSRRYHELANSGLVDDATMNEARLKMAFLPVGSTPIENPVGTAPAATLKIDNSVIVALPGVPQELKAIVEGPLESTLRAMLGGSVYRELELIAGCGDESLLAPILQAVVAAHPDAYIKSRAKGFDVQRRFLITISATGSDSEGAERRIEDARMELISVLERAGIKAESM